MVETENAINRRIRPTIASDAPDRRTVMKIAGTISG
jgi:hypothetical protein